ncbi:MAG: hypothetical protein GXO74_01075 [Calditrichaeota bacterium]|nr:hypothetical protein [Calditrichota bacterium]
MVELIPEKFSDSVRFFDDFFKLKISRADMLGLRLILEKFSALPYENISKIIKLSRTWNKNDKVRLPDEVMNDHADFHFGGTCFSLTFFLETILLRHGYQCYPVMGDMRAGKNIHSALIVTFQRKKYLVDPGYLLNQPLEINPQKPRLYRAEGVGVELVFNPQLDCYQLVTFNKEKMTWRYNFQDRACPKDEFVKHWEASFTKPSMHGICLTKLEKDGMIYIHKNFMRHTTFSDKKNFNIRANYHSTIRSIFGIDEEFVEQARLALKFNLETEQKMGLFIPRKK